MFDLSGGVRWDYFDTRYSLYVPNTTTPPTVASQDVSKPTYRAAFVYKPNRMAACTSTMGRASIRRRSR